MPALALEAVASHVIHGYATWLPLALFFPLAAFSASRLAGGTVWCRIGAATLYAVNPFVFNRVFVGHVPLLLGYALLPLATKSAIASRTAQGIRALSPALWWAVLTALSVHYCWIFGVVVVAVACSSRRHIGRTSLWFLANFLVFALTCAYLLLPHVETSLPVNIGGGSLSAFRTSADPSLGLFFNVIGLYGYWRIGPGPVLPKELFSGWPFIVVALVLISAAGASSLFRRHENGNSSCDAHRTLAIVLIVTGVLGLLLAMGDQGPTGALFRWAYFHVPFFNIMREPEKFLMLYAMALSIFFGRGVAELMARAKNLKRYATFLLGALLSLAIPLAYTPTIFGGLDGQLSLSTIPQSWSQVNRLVGNGPGKILYLPWHEYLSYSFTDGRVVANPAASSFSRNVIAGDNLQVAAFASNSTSARSSYLETLFASGTIVKNFGSLVAPLGVKFVILSKTVDWSNYLWLTHQSDLKLLMNTSNLEVWQNTDYEGVGARYSALSSVPNVSRLEDLALVDKSELAPYVLEKSPGKVQNPHAQGNDVFQVSSVQYDVLAGRPGWVAIDAPYESGWRDGNSLARPSAEGTVLVKVGSAASTIEFSPWRLVEIGYTVSSLVFVALVCAFMWSYVVRERSRVRQKKGTPLA